MEKTRNTIRDIEKIVQALDIENMIEFYSIIEKSEKLSTP